MEIKFVKDIDLKGATLIEGFPGLGLVGPMTTSYVIDKLEMEYVGYIDSADFPPIVSIHGGKPYPPVRLYYTAKKKILAVFSEFTIPMALINELSGKLFGLIKEKQVSQIISVGGMPARDEDDKSVYAIASTTDALKTAQKSGLNAVVEGVSAGVSAQLLLNACRANIPDINILVSVNPSIIDPKYAEQAINSINKLLNLNIDVTELEKEAKEIEAKVRDMMKKSKESHDNMKDAGSYGPPSMYA